MKTTIMETLYTKLRRLELYLSTHPDCEENSECADRLSDVQELLKEIPDLTTQLTSDKAELLEALENIVDYGGVANFDTLESLIQKHKQ